MPASLAVAVEHRDLVLLQQVADATAELLRHAAAALDHGGHVEARVVGREAEARRVPHQLQHLGRAQQRLGRDAAPVQADAAQMLALDQRHLHLELRGADRRHVAARAAADDDQVEALGHLFLPWCGGPASAEQRLDLGRQVLAGERIANGHAAVHGAVLHVFGQERGAAGTARTRDATDRPNS